MFNSSNQLRRLRQFLGLTQDEFAEKINTKRNNISMIESGRNKPTFEMIGEICKAFNISADYFLEDADPAESVVVNNNDGMADNVNAGTPKNQRDYMRLLINQSKDKRTDFVTHYYTTDPIGIKTKRLQDLKEKYRRKIERELAKEQESLLKLSFLVDDLSDLIELILDYYSNSVNNRPDPFETSQYFDLPNDKINIPDTVEYDKYKADVIDWLEKIKQFEPLIKDYYQQSQQFLEALETPVSN